MDDVVWRVTGDDAYYYFKLAQNLSQQLGATFDGINATNGFHPLYAGLLVPIFKIAGPNLDLGVHLALTLVAIINVATSWPVYLIGRRVYSPQAGRIGVWLFLLNPWVIIVAMTGVESAVYLFTLAWAILAYLVWRDRPTVRRALIAGLSMGICIMARSEGAVVLVGIVVDMIVQRHSTWRHFLASLGALLIGTTLVCLPWGAWSTLKFGAPFQVSSSAIFLISHADAPSALMNQLIWYISRTLWYSARFVYKILFYNAPALGLVLLVFISQLIRQRSWQSVTRFLRPAKPLAFLGLPFMLISIFYNAILWNQQHWYFSALILIPTLWAAPIIAAGLVGQDRRRQVRLIRIGRLGVVIFCLGILAVMWQRGLYELTGQHDFYLAGRWIAASKERQTRTYAYSDSGVLGYFCKCTMVNLDGVMNNAAYQFYRANGGYKPETQIAYLQANGIQYVLQSIKAAEDLYVKHAHLQRVDAIPETNLALYRIMP
jgi:hypothetical protein